MKYVFTYDVKPFKLCVANLLFIILGELLYMRGSRYLILLHVNLCLLIGIDRLLENLVLYW